MKKLFLIPLMAMLCTVMAWGETRTAGTFAELQQALSDANAGDVIELTADVTYPTNGTGLVNINKSITLDGKGHTLYGYGTATIKTDGTLPYPTALAVNASVFDAVNAPTLNVTLKNLTLGNIKNEYWPNGTQKAMVNSPERFYGLTVYDGVASLTMDNVNILIGRINNNDNKNSQPSGSHMMMCITGINSTPLDLTITNSRIYGSESKYPAYILKAINATLENSIFEGYCSLYFKYQYNADTYGATIGSRGSVIDAQNCAFNAPNVHSGQTNAFAIFPMEDDGITLNLTNCSFNAKQIGDQAQMVISMQGVTRTNGFQPVRVNFSGDNTHVYNVDLLTFALTGWNWDDDNNLTTYKPAVDAPLQLTISGGTFTINPKDIKFHKYKDGTSFDLDSARIADGYEVQEVKQGDVTLYRVVKAVAKDGSGDPLYNLNDDVPTDEPGAGNNPASSFELASGDTMTLNNETTTAGYVQIKDKGTDTTTVIVGQTAGGKDQTLVINNGLDVQGNSQVIVETGATVKIGEGGITTEKPENIVIETSEEKSGSLLLDPTITVNQNPKLTVKMVTKVGYDGADYYWHRFAMPVLSINGWEKLGSDGNPIDATTYIYRWDYDNNDWANVTAFNQLKPFYGYNLTHTKPYETEVTYVFEGNLVGNMDTKLKFTADGYNFFGNSYTAYIETLTMIEAIAGSNEVAGTVWVWNNDITDPLYQSYVSTSIYQLRNQRSHLQAFQKEIAPMQTFILQLRNGDPENVEGAVIDYSSAIWGNPRYNPAALAPVRATVNEDANVRISVVAANGKGDRVDFTENANYSDAYENDADATKYMNNNRINLYSTIGEEDYSVVVTDNIAGKTLSLQTVNDVNYTMSFSNVEGTQYAIRDLMTNIVTPMTEGNTYTFAAQPNSTVEGRFVIVPIQNMPTDVETVETTSAVKGIYTVMGQYVGEDFDILPAGVYVIDGVKVVK